MAPTFGSLQTHTDTLYHNQHRYNLFALGIVFILFIVIRLLRLLVVTLITLIKAVLYFILNLGTFIWEIVNNITRILELSSLFIGFTVELIGCSIVILFNELQESFYVLRNLHRIPYNQLISVGIRVSNNRETNQVSPTPEGSPFVNPFTATAPPRAPTRRPTGSVKRKPPKTHQNTKTRVRRSTRTKNVFQQQQQYRIQEKHHRRQQQHKNHQLLYSDTN